MPLTHGSAGSGLALYHRLNALLPLFIAREVPEANRAEKFRKAIKAPFGASITICFRDSALTRQERVLRSQPATPVGSQNL